MHVRLIWDFRGPDAKQTAEHFEEHLKEFLVKHSLALPTGVTPGQDSTWAAYCDPPDLPGALVQSESHSADEEEAVADRIGRALRPSRVEIS